MDDDCRKPYWHPYEDCEDSDAVAARQLRKMKSDLFLKHGVVPAAQKKIMDRNSSTSPLLRLPPELRLQIYKHVFGGQRLWIDFQFRKYQTYGKIPLDKGLEHHGARFSHFYIEDPDQKLDIRLLRVCRQIFTEAALLPYALNEFVFESRLARRQFVKSMRPGKKRVAKEAIGAYRILRPSTSEWTWRNMTEKLCMRAVPEVHGGKQWEGGLICPQSTERKKV